MINVKKIFTILVVIIIYNLGHIQYEFKYRNWYKLIKHQSEDNFLQNLDDQTLLIFLLLALYLLNKYFKSEG